MDLEKEIQEKKEFLKYDYVNKKKIIDARKDYCGRNGHEEKIQMICSTNGNNPKVFCSCERCLEFYYRPLTIKEKGEFNRIMQDSFA